MANPAKQPISGRIAKMALFNPCMKFKKKNWVKLILLKCFESATKWLYPKHVSGSVQVLKTADKWINWIISKMHHSIWKILSVLGADEYLERLEGKIRKCLFFYVKIF